MNISELKGKKVTVMGLGLHGGGIGTARFLAEAGAKVIVTDLKSKEELAPSLEKLKDAKGIEFVLGQHRPEDFSNTDIVVKTPVAPWSNKYIKLALEKNIPVEIDSSLFFKLCKNPIIGITGTKGKTTTATLIYEILKKTGRNVVKVGISQVSVLDKLKELKKDSMVVFELSSWRLSALGKYRLSPQIAVFTNIFPDHLNYYAAMEEYLKDKKYIFSNQKPKDFCVINWDDETLNKLEKEIPSETVKFSKSKISDGKTVFVESGSIYLNDGIDEKKVLDLAQLKLKGEHNLENILAGIGAAFASGVEIGEIKKAISEFDGISHRLELVRILNGIKFYNDTAATNPGSAMAGIRSFSEPIILICGGSDKKLDMTEFAKAIRDEVKGVVFLKGEATDKLISVLKKIMPDKNRDSDFVIVESMGKAVELAKMEAESGDVVLLSPGAASFGLFLDEFDRGNKFKEIVKGLK